VAAKVEEKVITRFREHTGALKLFEKVMLISMMSLGTLFMLDLHSRLRVLVYMEQWLAVFLGFVLVLSFVMAPATKRERPGILPWYDILLALISIVVCGYVVINWPDIVNTAGIISTPRVILGILAVLLVLEACRRFYGWFLVGITIFFIIYALFGSHFPEPFTCKSIPWDRLATILYLDKSALFGMATEVAGTVIVAFILFGALMVASGAGQFLIDLSLSVFGRMKGGVAKVPVVASATFGSISGLAVANIYATGAVTIPMMKKHGVEPHVAAAIEGVAATGGIILPPVMGIVAFIMAAFLNMSYASICIAAAIPAILYYIAVYVQVDRYAARSGFGSVARDQVPSFKKVLREGWIFILPVVVLVYTMFILYLRPDTCALLSAAAFVVVGMLRLRSKTRLTFRKLAESFETAGRSTLELAAVCGLIGIMIGAFLYTGLGFSLAQIVFSFAGGNLFIILLISAVLCIILGTGLPQVTIYVIVALLVAPILTKAGGVPDLASHMFIFYYGLVGFLTPPFMLSVYASANLAGADHWKTAWRSLRLCIVAYIVPFAFVYDYALLAQGSAQQIAFSATTAAIGTIMLALGLEGFMFRKVPWVFRVLLIAGGIALYTPFATAKFVGLGIGVFVILLRTLIWMRTKRIQANA